MKPTTMGAPTVIGASTGSGMVPQQATDFSVALAGNAGQIALLPEQIPTAEAMLSGLRFSDITSGDILMIGHGAEIALTETLDGFLSGIERARNPKLFALFDRLQSGVEDAKLPDLLKQIQSGKLGFKARVLGFMSKRAVADAAHTAHEAVCELVSGRTQDLMGVMKNLEKELAQALDELLRELQRFNQLKGTYRQHINDFAVVAVVAHKFLESARAEVGRARLDANSVLAQSDLQEAENKLQLLESRALALEGVFSRLPADQLVIQQVEAAGVQTLQETATTATTRFSSIKTTLIALHGAMQVKGVQQLAAKQADLDRQLGQIRGTLMREVVTTAANAPGDNRLQQANQLQELIALTGEVQALVDTARTENLKKFDTARGMFAEARGELAQLSSKPKA
jgi:hypothetical protein